jgi:hypothetical protein
VDETPARQYIEEFGLVSRHLLLRPWWRVV